MNKRRRLYFFIFTLLILNLDAGFRPANAQIIQPASGIIKAIIGEASNQPFEGQIAVACAIINRPEGLEGVYGAYMKRIPSLQETALAKRAYMHATPKVCYTLIRGADMWENVQKYGHPPWDNVIFITKIGDHSFYRRITGK